MYILVKLQIIKDKEIFSVIKEKIQNGRVGNKMIEKYN